MARPEVRDDVALMGGYHSPQVDVRVRLNTNEAPDPPPAAFTDALAVAMRGLAWNRYPDRGATALRGRIAEVEGPEVPSGIDAANVFAANGSNEVLQTLCLAYGGAGRTVLTHEPTYALHSHIARVCGTAVVEGGRNGDFTLDVAAVVDRIHAVRPAITFLCSPNNPTGRIEDRSTVRDVLGAVESVDGLLVVDEAYGQFSPWSALSLVDEDRSVVVSRTYSKTWSAAGLRLGYLIGPTWCIDELGKVVLPYHLDAIKQLAGSSLSTTSTRCVHVSPASSSSGAGWRTRSPSSGSTSGHRTRTSSCSGLDTVRVSRSGPTSWSGRCWSATARRGRG